MKKLCTLSIALMIASMTYAQIPNAGFETWTSHTTYSEPDGWQTNDSLTNLVGVYTCTEGSPGFAGAHYIDLTSRTIPSVGVAAAIAVSGTVDFTTYLPKTGFAYTGHPTSLTGEWQYAPAAVTDTPVIAVGLTKWNGVKRDTVGYAYYKPLGSVTTWTAFSIPITYLTAETPDTAEIYLASSGLTAVNGSYLYVDTLAFAGATGTGITAINSGRSPFSVYPNPSDGLITINIPSGYNEEVKVTITNTIGATIKTTAAITNEPITIQLHEPAGLYFIRAVSMHGMWI